ncbi:MAG: nicotinamide riboside transporter PnuC [Bacteroidales bacterium]|jgi:nicotinamide mononucleotide transporter|nr:nicotinamide riboside transporter PnuC [Bacteroidales bacterium]
MFTEFFSTNNILFSIAGQGVSVLETFSVALGLLTVFLATRGKVANFIVGYVYTVLLFFLFLQKHLYASMMLQPISLAINIYGNYRWTHPKEGEKGTADKLKISLLSGKSRITLAAVALAFMFFWGFMLSNLNNWNPSIFPASHPYLDAFVNTMILGAQYLSAQKKLECWGAWFVVDGVNIVLYIIAGLAFMPIVEIGYFVLAIAGFFMWLKEYKEYGINEKV